jgi:Domain of unknown function (DUF1996)
VSHFNFDDPIVFPGTQNATHLHVYFGNTGARFDSTASSLVNSGNSTCTGGILNRSSYWVPAMIDAREGRPLTPLPLSIYYKVGYNGIPSSAIRPFPQGLRMIAGNSKATAPQDVSIVHFHCHAQSNGAPVLSATIPASCPAGSVLQASIEFPQCWDGTNLDSPDHKSHMAYPSGGRCPSTHPVPIPQITYNVVYRVANTGDTAYWRLSSDLAGAPAGSSNHADWFAAWRGSSATPGDYVPNVFVRDVLNRGLDGHTYLLGNGWALTGQP